MNSKAKKNNSTTVEVSVGNILEQLDFSLSPQINTHYSQMNSHILNQYKILWIQEKYFKVQTFFRFSYVVVYARLRVQYS